MKEEESRKRLLAICLDSDLYNPEDTKMAERLESELNTLKTQELCRYYLALKLKGESVDTRSHLVAYLIGIAEEFDDFADRPYMGDMPDIDIDFSEKEPVIDYLKQKYGEDHVALVNNYVELSGKSAINDICRVMEIPVPAKIKDQVSAAGSAKNFLKTKANTLSKEHLEVLKYAAKLEENIRHYSVSAAGVIISNRPVSDYSGVWYDKGNLVSVFDKKDVEKIGFIKMDVLRVVNIRVIQKCLSLIEERGGTPPENIWDVPYDDPRIMEEFRRANVDLIFQYKGFATKALLSKLDLDNTNDLIAAHALSRPGPDENEYIKNKNLESFNYPHPAIEESLKATYGVMLYQEQVMEICRKYALMSARDSNRVRKMVAKKDLKEAPQLKDIFVRGAIRNDSKREVAESLWALILRHGEYSFNVSHATAYFIIGWCQMYLQVYYPFEWILANLVVAETEENKNATIKTAMGMGIKFSYADVNRSKFDWSYDGDTLVPGLDYVPGVGPKAAQLIADNAPYKDEDDMLKRLPKRVYNIRVRNALREAGAIPGLDGDKIKSAVSAGLPVDVLEGKEIHPNWNPVNYSVANGICVVQAYVKKCRKNGKIYNVFFQSDIPGVLKSEDKVEEGACLLFVDAQWGSLFGYVPEDKFHTHPSETKKFKSFRSLGAGDTKGVAYVVGSKKINRNYPTLVLAPQPRIIWMGQEVAPKTFGVFAKDRESNRWAMVKKIDGTSRTPIRSVS